MSIYQPFNLLFTFLYNQFINLHLHKLTNAQVHTNTHISITYLNAILNKNAHINTPVCKQSSLNVVYVMRRVFSFCNTVVLAIFSSIV